MKSMRVVIVAENVSMRMGGEAALPFYYFKLLRARYVDVWMVCHARVREELREAFPNEDFQKISFVEDTWVQGMVWRISHWFPNRTQMIFEQWLHLSTQRRARTVVKKMIDELDIQIVFEPSPITPKGLSFMYNMGVPIVIGPMCGGLEFPPAFRYMDSPLAQISISVGRFLSSILHRFVPGKLQADTLIVANKCTANALPKGYRGKVYEVVESGVDLSIWKPTQCHDPQPQQPVRFVYSGRFVDWKGVQFLVEAFKQVASRTNSVLELIGDGKLRSSIEGQVAALNIQERVNFHGWMTREDSAKIIRDCNVFVLPSLRECGGAVVLEAMAMGKPIVATNWAGPGNYVDSTCGILVEPTSREAFINGLAAAMIRFAESQELRCRIGEASTQRVTKHYFDWESKTDRVLEILKDTLVQQRN
jgi:glycosyltransferase involved in cell wall biosynthesis